MRSTPSPFSFATRSLRCAVAGLAGVVLLLGTACDKEKAAPPAPPVVDVVTVTQKDVPIYLEWIGVMDGDVNATKRIGASAGLTLR